MQACFCVKELVVAVLQACFCVKEPVVAVLQAWTIQKFSSILDRGRSLLFLSTPTPSLRHTCSSNQRKPGPLSLGINWPEREDNPSSVSSSECNNVCSLTSTLSYPSNIWCWIQHWCTSTFFFVNKFQARVLSRHFVCTHPVQEILWLEVVMAGHWTSAPIQRLTFTLQLSIQFKVDSKCTLRYFRRFLADPLNFSSYSVGSQAPKLYPEHLTNFKLCDSICLYYLNPLQTKRRPLYLKTQSVTRCKHFSSRL
jgi:hypothetical protein